MKMENGLHHPHKEILLTNTGKYKKHGEWAFPSISNNSHNKDLLKHLIFGMIDVNQPEDAVIELEVYRHDKKEKEKKVGWEKVENGL